MTWLSDAALERLGAAAVASEADPSSDGRYELIDVLGRGGMGVVWRALDRRLGREVALKLLDEPGDGAECADLAERLLREARVLAGLEHPGIVPVHDAGRLPDGRVFYAMKRVQGRRLDHEVRAGRPLPELLRTFERLCQCVAFAHAQGVLHRDLKPENVMLGAFGEVLVLDWGVARATSASAPRAGGAPPRPGDTAHGTVLGTPGYMAPEQARGEVERVDARADVYGLGGVLYFMLTGRAPGAAEAGGTGSTWTWRPRVRSGSAPALVPPRQITPDLPARLEAIVLKALAHAPEQRYAGANELQADVARFLAGEPVRAYPEGPLDKARRLAARHRVALVLLLAYLAMRLTLIFLAGR